MLFMLEQGKIPDKLYFRIGEVAKMIGVEPYVLRYWETEFPEIAPVKSKARQRLYKRQDVELIYNIRDLLYRQNFTIKGARRKIKELSKNKGPVKGQQEQQKQIEFGFENQSKAPPISSKSLHLIQDVISEMDEFVKS